MTFFENKFQRLHAARSWQQKYRIKAVLRLSLWWNGKHPLPPLRLVCFHLSLCFYFSSPPENPHSIFVSYLPLSLTVIEGQTTSCSYGVKTFPHQHPIISWSLHSRYLHTLSLFFTLVFSPSPYTPWQIQFFILPIASTVGWNGANLKKGTVVQKKKKMLACTCSLFITLISLLTPSNLFTAIFKNTNFLSYKVLFQTAT